MTPEQIREQAQAISGQVGPATQKLSRLVAELASHVQILTQSKPVPDPAKAQEGAKAGRVRLSRFIETHQALKDITEQFASWLQIADPEQISPNDEAVLAKARQALALCRD